MDQLAKNLQVVFMLFGRYYCGDDVALVHAFSFGTSLRQAVRHFNFRAQALLGALQTPIAVRHSWIIAKAPVGR
ncbi:MAG: hypothetical protein WBQ61_07395 [Candidatus Acidiferrum sp.]